MTAALEGGEWSAARSGRTLPPAKTRYSLYRRLGGPHGRSGRVENLVPTGIRSRTVQPIVSRYTDWATRPLVMNWYLHYLTYKRSSNEQCGLLKITLLWNLKPCSLVDTCNDFGGACCLCLRYGRASLCRSWRRGLSPDCVGYPDYCVSWLRSVPRYKHPGSTPDLPTIASSLFISIYCYWPITPSFHIL